MNWLWCAVGAAAVIPACIAHARYRHRRWVRRHTYVVEVEIR